MARWRVARSLNHSRAFAQRRVKVQQAIRYRVIGPIRLTFQFAAPRTKLRACTRIRVSFIGFCDVREI